MFKRIINLMRQDWINSLRDNILLYMMFGPILLAVGARFFLPSLDQVQFTFAVQDSLDPVLIERLERIGAVERYPDAGALKRQVLRTDDMPGILLKDGQPVLVYEGNEGEDAYVMQSVIAQALSGETVAQYTRTQINGARSLVTEYMAIVFIMIGTLLGSLVMAFNLIEDKETRAIKALGVSPLSMLEFSLARGLFAFALSTLIVITTTFILLGTHVQYGLLLVGIVFSIGLPLLTGYFIGGLADNQLKAIAILKFTMLIYLTLPALSIFIPRHWHVFFYPLPNYWMWQTFEKLFIGNLGGPGFWLSGVIAMALSLALVMAALPVLRRQLKLR